VPLTREAVDGVLKCPVHAIYAGEDVPPEFQSDIEFNATEARRVKRIGAGCHRDEKGSLADRRPKESGIGLISGGSPAQMSNVATALWARATGGVGGKHAEVALQWNRLVRL